MKEKLINKQPVTKVQPDHMSDQTETWALPNKVLSNYLKSLNCVMVDGCKPDNVFVCLRLLSYPSRPDAIVIDNTGNANQLILLDRNYDLFFIGYDTEGNQSSNGILSSNSAKGNNFTILNDRFIVIVRTFDAYTELLTNTLR